MNMKRSVLEFRNLLVVFFISLGLQLSTSIYAQEEVRESKSVSISTTAEGKVQLKVIIKKGNDETTFEKTYDSQEEMQNDPDLEKYGIDLGFNGQGFGSSSRSPQFFFHNGPASKFWDDESFQLEMEEMRRRMKDMMQGFDSGGFFNFDSDSFIDMDSLMSRFQFRNDNGRFFYNGEEITDLDSLQDALKDKFDQFQFDFDFGSPSKGGFGSWHDQDDEDVKVITRAKVYVRTARDEDKALVGTDDMETLQLNDISFYPNPSDGRFDLELNTLSDEPVQLIIVDQYGNEVYNRLSTPENGALEKRIDLTNEGKGIYVLKVIQGNKALTKRIIVE